MTRRIVLEDSQIHFFDKLADLSFTEQKDSGLWIPPEGLAVGAIAPVETPRAVDVPSGDLSARIEVFRPMGSLVLRFGFPLRSPGQWRAVPSGSILFNDGKRLDGFTVFADIKDA